MIDLAIRAEVPNLWYSKDQLGNSLEGPVRLEDQLGYSKRTNWSEGQLKATRRTNWVLEGPLGTLEEKHHLGVHSKHHLGVRKGPF
ncbi:hypothetical protein AVEN_181659-1 [Araneus ventricosus]|uniref:Uncharacterized protein n=1 Tax=Araneus ventricosus TaxID=182803 RepID=A0A4Y2SGL3_ARAVE|nr:hypothetical protein AVEN_181659-1 [Araneus ventricosus]